MTISKHLHFDSADSNAFFHKHSAEPKSLCRFRNHRGETAVSTLLGYRNGEFARHTTGSGFWSWIGYQSLSNVNAFFHIARFTFRAGVIVHPLYAAVTCKPFYRPFCSITDDFGSRKDDASVRIFSRNLGVFREKAITRVWMASQAESRTADSPDAPDPDTLPMGFHPTNRISQHVYMQSIISIPVRYKLPQNDMLFPEQARDGFEQGNFARCAIRIFLQT